MRRLTRALVRVLERASSTRSRSRRAARARRPRPPAPHGTVRAAARRAPRPARGRSPAPSTRPASAAGRREHPVAAGPAQLVPGPVDGRGRDRERRDHHEDPDRPRAARPGSSTSPRPRIQAGPPWRQNGTSEPRSAAARSTTSRVDVERGRHTRGAPRPRPTIHHRARRPSGICLWSRICSPAPIGQHGLRGAHDEVVVARRARRPRRDR